MNLLQDIFVYFAKYPANDAVEKFFNKKHTMSESYNQLKKRYECLTDKNKFPAITDYIFGVNEDVVRKRISQVKGIYLFIDYGNIDSKVSDKNVKIDSFQLAVTIAKVTSSSSFDLAEELIMSDELLDIISAIRNNLRNDKENPFVKWINFPNTISPFFARELSSSYGWTLLFNVNGVDLI